jgi:hypothetical protein
MIMNLPSAPVEFTCPAEIFDHLRATRPELNVSPFQVIQSYIVMNQIPEMFRKLVGQLQDPAERHSIVELPDLLRYEIIPLISVLLFILLFI